MRFVGNNSNVGRLSNTESKSCCYCALFSWFTGVSDNSVPGTDGRILDPELRRMLREEVTRLVQLIPTKDHKRQGMEETLVRVIMRGLPKDDEIHRILGILSPCRFL